jgi:energy-coupling factor transporter ATP-binding protein EcfA2
MADRKEEESKVEAGNISNVSGEVTIAGRDVHKGFTAEQVSNLLIQIKTTFQPKPFDGRCPYKGLDAFEEEDTELFFGREKLIKELVMKVQDFRTIFITGPSGSGKSSLVRAGLIPALKRGDNKNLYSERWLYGTMKPGSAPIKELARVVSGIARDLKAGETIRKKGLEDATVLAQWCEIALGDNLKKRAVIFIDQFEELFTQVKDINERIAFLDLLTYAVTVENGRVIIVFAMRSDFVSNCSAYPKLNDLLNQQFTQVGTMQPDELVSAIAQPALRVSMQIDPKLIAQIINDMAGEPGVLPLMQFALEDLFNAERAKGGMFALSLGAYIQRGGIHKALKQHAITSFAKLDEKEQELAYSIFDKLIEIGHDKKVTRRTALFDELVPSKRKEDVVKIIKNKLADARLITTGEQDKLETVTIGCTKSL